jgi:hypothetical protein
LTASPSNFNAAIQYNVRRGLDNLLSKPYVEACEGFKAICEIGLGIAWELFRRVSYEVMETLDLIAASAIRIGRRDMFWRACDYFQRMLRDAVTEFVPRATARILGDHMADKVCHPAKSNRSIHEKCTSTHHYWKYINSCVSWGPTLQSRIGTCELFIEAFECTSNSK